MTPSTAARWATEIEQLTRAISVIIEAPTPTATPKPKRKPNAPVVLSCSCRTIKVARRVAGELGDVECQRCGEALSHE